MYYRNEWSAFILESSTTLAMMGLWEELQLSLDFILNADLTPCPDDPASELASSRSIGPLVSLLDLALHGVIPANILPMGNGARLLRQAEALAQQARPVFNAMTAKFATNQSTDSET